MGESGRTERWAELSGRVGAEMAAWRAEHPRASWREIEAALEERWRAVRAQLLKEVAEESPAANLRAAAGAGEPARCADCGAVLRDQGRRSRQVTTDGQHPLVLERGYGICPACGTGHFPPG